MREVLACERENGFGNCLPGVARSLPWTAGAMLSAARRARERGGVAVAPCSGFHHARWDDCGGFCTFNGLMVTSAVLRAEGVRRIGILDLDNHYGNGTEAILDQLDARSWVRHFTAGAQYRRPSHASEFLTRLPSEVARFADCDVVLYQAGADPHVNDPLGGWLTTEQLRERDGLVFSGLKALGIPVRRLTWPGDISWMRRGAFPPSSRSMTTPSANVPAFIFRRDRVNAGSNASVSISCGVPGSATPASRCRRTSVAATPPRWRLMRLRSVA